MRVLVVGGLHEFWLVTKFGHYVLMVILLWKILKFGTYCVGLFRSTLEIIAGVAKENKCISTEGQFFIV